MRRRFAAGTTADDLKAYMAPFVASLGYRFNTETDFVDDVLASELEILEATGVALTLDSDQGHSVGIGADARGEANLSVRHEGEAYEGTGTSRDVIEASALAWLDVANRLLRQRQGSRQAETSNA